MAEAVIERTIVRNSWRAVLPEVTGNLRADAEVYALVGLVVRQFVDSWHGKITEEREFLVQVAIAIGQVAQGLAKRCEKLEMDEVLLDGIPSVILTHIRDIELARERLENDSVPYKGIEEAFMSVHGHPAMNSREDEQLFVKVLAKGLTVALLDDSAVKSQCASSLVTSIISDIGIKNLTEKLSEPWMIYEIFTNSILATLSPAKKQEMASPSPAKASFERTKFLDQVKGLYVKAIQGFASAIASGAKALELVLPYYGSSYGAGIPVAQRTVFPMITGLLGLNKRKPLLTNLIYGLSVPLRAPGTILARLSTGAVSGTINKHINIKVVETILQNARRVVFPNDGPMGPPRIIPNPQQQLEIKVRTRQVMLDVIPDGVVSTVLGGAEECVDHFLGIFENKTINKHLVYRLLDYLVLALVGELGELTPSQLKQARQSPH